MPPLVLLAYWDEISDELTALAMAYEASCHPDPGIFMHREEDAEMERSCNFYHDRECWDPDLPAPRPYDLMVALIREVCHDSDFHEKPKES